jgi:CRP/FNR family transcriptional regulator
MLAGAPELRALVNFFHSGTKLAYSKGDFVIRPGAHPPGIFYIERGLVKAYDITKYGEENMLIIRKDGEFLGLTWGITGEDKRIIYAAIAPTTVWMVPRKTFTDFIRANPEAALPIIDTLTEMYRLHSERIMTLEYRTVRERLISFLLTTADRFGESIHNKVRISVPLRHLDIASSISATRETTTRAMLELERKKLVSSKQSYITLLDVNSLKQCL